MDNHVERVMDWGGDIIAAYVRIAKVLAALVLPIEVPMNLGDAGFIKDAQAAIVRSIRLIQDQPMDEIIHAMVRQVLLDWLNAMDLAAIELTSPMTWREDVFEYTLMRCLAGADLALEEIHKINEE